MKINSRKSKNSYVREMYTYLSTNSADNNSFYQKSKIKTLLVCIIYSKYLLTFDNLGLDIRTMDCMT